MSAFYGIVILMFANESRHLGRPHFHAQSAGMAASFDIETLEIIAGRLPRRATRLVVQWAEVHQPELRTNWRRARASRPLIPIEPLR